MRRLIRLLMDTPLRRDKIVSAEEATSLDSYKGKNTDVKTRILLNVVLDATRGDLKAAEFLMK